ncbi:MAG: M17 family peptidase N-terminal domain-containing protein, partial [Bradyrhizobium sp.]
MPDAVKVGFVPLSATPRGILVVFCDDALRIGDAALKALNGATDLIKRAAAAAQFKGKDGAVLDLLAPEGIKIQRLMVIGTGKGTDLKDKDFLKYGGTLAGRLNAASEAVTVVAELPGKPMTPDEVSALASGVKLRIYRFDRYKTKKKDEEGGVRADIALAVADPAAAKKAFAPRAHITDGVMMARDLVNEPPNILYPEEFAKRAANLRALDVDVDILDVAAMKKLGMGALLGVGQGSAKETKLVVLQWKGGATKDAPIALVGKGVTFDTGGISLKPGDGMWDMKWDMGGAGAVAGAMKTLAMRKAKAIV